MSIVFVAGCFDFIHGGHIQFLEDARKLGDKLIVSIASDDVLRLCKGRKPILPVEHRVKLLSGLSMVDQVVISSDLDAVFDFKTAFIQSNADVLAVTTDDKHMEEMKRFCVSLGKRFVVLPKRPVVSSTSLSNQYRAPDKIPYRVDFAGGWLDAPQFSRQGGFIVNCAIEMFFNERTIVEGSGLGGSAATVINAGENSFASEKEVGWQDPAIILETGLCVWRSGNRPVLELKANPDFLQKMGIYWTGNAHKTKSILGKERDYDAIDVSGGIAYRAVLLKDWDGLCRAVDAFYATQIDEGMKSLPYFGEKACKYLGAGWGGYALYLFDNDQPIPKEIEQVKPYLKMVDADWQEENDIQNRQRQDKRLPKHICV